MKLRSAVVLPSVCVLASACGSLSSRGVGPSQRFAAGDRFTYASTSIPTGNTIGSRSASLLTRRIKQVSGNSFTTVETRSDDLTWSQCDTDTDFQEINWHNGTESCTNNPKNNSIGSTLAIGKTWDITYTRTCTGVNASSYQYRSRGRVTGSESIVTPAGTFDTYKLAYEVTSTSLSGKSVHSYTCWRDKIFNMPVACDYTTAHTPSGAIAPTSTWTNTERLTNIWLARSLEENRPQRNLTVSGY